MKPSRHLYSPSGYWVAFLVGEDVFWRDGERMGWFEACGTSIAGQAGGNGTGQDDVHEWSGGVVTAHNGERIGTVTEQGVLELAVPASLGM